MFVDSDPLVEQGGPERRTIENGVHPTGFFNRIVGLSKLIDHACGGHFVQFRVGPGMVGNFVAFIDRAFDDFRPGSRASADEEKGGLDAPLFQDIQQAGRICCMWSIVEGQGDDLVLHAALEIDQVCFHGQRAGQ